MSRVHEGLPREEGIFVAFKKGSGDICCLLVIGKSTAAVLEGVQLLPDWRTIRCRREMEILLQ